MTVSSGARSVSSPPKSSVPGPRGSPAALGARGETEAVVVGEGGGVRAAAARWVPRPARSRVLKAPLPHPQPALHSVSPGAPLSGTLRGREEGGSGSGWVTSRPARALKSYTMGAEGPRSLKQLMTAIPT